ncbi:MAG: hypothetical protein M3417_01840 [Actinomycetota bacterium]|nr:hypothetical protein [Actinomycetota bacterium]
MVYAVDTEGQTSSSTADYSRIPSPRSPHMAAVEVAVRIDEHYTASSAAAPAARYSKVVYLGAVSTRSADVTLAAPEDPVDLEAAGTALGFAAKVIEYDVSPVNSRSPFGV